MNSIRWGLILAVVCLQALALPVSAEVPPQGVGNVDKEQLVSNIQQHLKAGEFEQAVEKLEVLYRLDKKTVTLFNIAIAREKQRASCLVRASAYERVLKACHGCDEELNARKRLAEIRGDCFGTLVITTEPEGLEVTVNGRSVGRTPIEAEFAEGRYVIGARRGGDTTETEVDVVRKSFVRAQLTVAPVALQPSATAAKSKSTNKQNIWPWVVAGSGLLLAGTGTYLLMDAHSTHDDAASQPGRVTYGAYQDAESQQTLGGVLTITGVAAVFGGLTWWLLSSEPSAQAPGASETPTVRVGFGPAMLVIGGTIK